MKLKPILGLLALVLFVVSCKTSESDPKVALKNFIHALGNQNLQEAKKYATKDSEPVMSMIEMGMKMAPDSATKFYKEENIDMGEAKIDGDIARIPVKEKQSGEETIFTLKKENKEWKVAFDKATLMEMAQKQMQEKGFSHEDMNADMENINMDSVRKGLENMTPEQKQKLESALDSATKVLDKMQKEGKLNNALDSAALLLEKMKQQ